MVLTPLGMTNLRDCHSSLFSDADNESSNTEIRAAQFWFRVSLYAVNFCGGQYVILKYYEVF